MQADALRPGDPKRLGSYELLGRLGDGGQGIVFLGRADDGSEVAIKLLHRELTADEVARTRFLREIEFAKQVASFCTAQIIDADIEGEQPYLVSEYVPGPSVLQLVQTDGPISGGALDRLAIGTATALVAIHQAGVIHRDFKPGNVLIGPGGPRVIDFGIARVFGGSTTMTSRVIGTPAFMSPEQLRGAEFGKKADIFCWAATMVYAATGRPPFGNDSIPAVIQRVLNEEPDLGDLSEPLRGLVVDCLAKDPAARPEARVLLMRLLGQEDAPPETAPAGGDADPAAILVKIAEATSAPLPADEAGNDADDIWRTPAELDTEPPWTPAPAPVTQSMPPAAARTPFGEPSRPEPVERKRRFRGAALVIAAAVAVVGTVGGTAYVMAQSSPGGVQHVNNPTTEPVPSETPTETPSPTKSKKPKPIIRSTQPSPSPTPSESKTTKTPSQTPTRTHTPTRTPTVSPSEPNPSSTPPEPTVS
jgi:serine/threonine protein kinase